MMRHGRVYEGDWFRYQPLCYNRYTGREYAGRISSVHLAEAEDDEALTAACGKRILWFDMDAQEGYGPPSPNDGAYTLRRYCKACLKSVGIDKPRDPQRDHQRQRVYDAEFAVESGLSDFHAADLAEAGEYANLVLHDALKSDAFGCRFDPTRVRVRARRGNQGRAHANAKEIAFGSRSMSEYVILHELAHTIHRRIRRYHRLRGWRDLDDLDHLDHSGHGAVFVAVLLVLVDRCLGKTRGNTLRESLRERGVKWEEWDEINPNKETT